MINVMNKYSLIALPMLVLLNGCASTSSSNSDGPQIPSSEQVLKQGLKVSKGRPLTASKQAQNSPSQSSSQILRGSQQFINTSANKVRIARHDGKIMFNFSNQPIDAVVNSILGDLLHKNYSISSKVKGKVSYSSAQPVDEKQALNILETLLSWTGNALIKQDNRYEVVTKEDALDGNLVPLAPAQKPPAGLSAQLFPLHYISAKAMAKLLKPYAAKDAFLLVDPGRNVLVLAGTSEQLAHYRQTIKTFDVNWLKGMSVGIFSLEHASAKSLLPQLRRVFGKDGQTPMAGMLRFLPIYRTNSIVVISAQPEYLDDIGRWIHTIDDGGKNRPQLYVYDVENIQASKLAKYLRDIYGQSNANSSSGTVSPTMSATTLQDSGLIQSTDSTSSDSSSTLSSSSTTSTGLSSASSDSSLSSSSSDSFGDDDSAQTSSDGSSSTSMALNKTTRITAESESNQLLVRTLPSQWQEMRQAIRQLDVSPSQVQIQTRILEVSLTGDLERGVQWYLGNLAGESGSTSSVVNSSGSQASVGGGGTSLGDSDNLFYSFVSGNMQVALHALETSSRTQVLSAPSLVVVNNQKARIQVGDNVPVTETSISTDSDNTVSSVDYIETGVILDVKPRISSSGRIYLNIRQQVSDADDSDSSSNPTISTRLISTRVAVNDGQTVMLGGLIKQSNSDSQQHVPWIGHIPVLRWLFGYEAQSKSRTELLVLITPRLIKDDEKAAAITNEYEQQMELMKTANSN